MISKPQKIVSLDGLRGLAAIYVMIYHYQMHQQFGFSPFTTFVDHGYLSVDLFFILSGYVITLADARLFEPAGGFAAVRWFLIKRVARIYPLYLISMLIALSLAVLLGDGVDTTPINVLANMSMIQAWGVGDSINGATWSLSAEWAAYLVFPVLCMLGRGSFGGIFQIGTGALALCLAASPIADHSGGSSNGPLDLTAPTTIWPVARCLGGFLVGCGLRRLCLHKGARLDRLCVVAAIAAIACLFVPKSDLAFVAAVSVVIACLPHDRWIIGAALSARPMAWLGKVSYSVYLLHTAFFLLEVRFANLLPLPHGIARIVTLFTFYAGVIICAGLAYRYIEQPGQALLRQWLRGPETRRDAVSVRA